MSLGYVGVREEPPCLRRGFLHYAEFRTVGVLMAVVLIVEDEVFTRQNAGWTIEDLGHSTLLACDPGEALAHLATQGDIDALFVDIRLGNLPLGGYDIADQAIKLRPQLRVLYTSGSTLTAEMTDQFVGGGRFIQKPYSANQLELSVEALLHQNSP